MTAAKGAQTKSRTKFIENGDTNTAYFLNLEKRNTAKNTITALKRTATFPTLSAGNKRRDTPDNSTLKQRITEVTFHSFLTEKPLDFIVQEMPFVYI